MVSYEKLTSEGMTFHPDDLLRIVEHLLPARFGGDATDYQLLEEEGPDGLPTVTLLVSPRLGPLEDAQLLAAVHAELGHRSAIGAQVFQQANLLRVRRAEPVPTARGKLFPLHIRRPAS